MDILPSRINHNQVAESAAALTRCSEEGGGGGEGGAGRKGGFTGREYVIVIRSCLAFIALGSGLAACSFQCVCLLLAPFTTSSPVSLSLF